MSSPFPRRLQLLAAMNAAYERGDLQEAHRLEDEHLAELTGRGRRTDAAPKQQKAPADGEGDGIDWANVAREASIMVKLNQGAAGAEPEEAEA